MDRTYIIGIKMNDHRLKRLLLEVNQLLTSNIEVYEASLFTTPYLSQLYHAEVALRKTSDTLHSLLEYKPKSIEEDNSK